MNLIRWSREQIALVAIVTLVCVAALFSVGLIGPKPVANSGLSTEWQCSKTGGILTVCTKNHA
jgi:hypothetical protein